MKPSGQANAAIDDDHTSTTCAKRRKMEHKSLAPTHLTMIRSVLADELTNPVPTETVVCATLANQADIALAMRELMLRLPLARLQHLKRVRHDRRIILFTEHDFIEEISASKVLDLHAMLVADLPHTDGEDFKPNVRAGFQDNCVHLGPVTRQYLRHKNVATTVIDILCSLPVCLQTVAAQPPTLRWQCDVANANWPCKFHPNRALEEQYTNNVFNAAQTDVHLRNMRIVLAASRHSSGRPAGLAIDPRSGNIVAVGVAQSADTHPLMHSAMVLIDAVARSQNAGAWNDWPTPTMDTCNADTSEKPADIKLCVNGVPQYLRPIIAHEFPDAQIGAQQLNNAGKMSHVVVEREDGAGSGAAADNLTKYGPYLCTGYDVYLSEEPCMLCAMALVHSRARTVFYHRRTTNGALGSLAKLHMVKALNHHFDVYEIGASES